MLTFGANCTLIQKKPFYVATQCERLSVGWGCGAGLDVDVNDRCKLHAHTEETLLPCYTMRTTECGVGVGWGGMLMFGSNCTLIQKKPFYVATQCERLSVGWGCGAGLDVDVNDRCKLHAHTEETLLPCYTMRTTECGVGWDVNVRFKLHAHTEETLLRCYTTLVLALRCACIFACTPACLKPVWIYSYLT